MTYDFHSEPTYHVYETRFSDLNNRLNNMLSAIYDLDIYILLQTTDRNDKLSFTCSDKVMGLLSNDFPEDEDADNIIDKLIMKLYAFSDEEYGGMVVYYDIDDAIIQLYKKI